MTDTKEYLLVKEELDYLIKLQKEINPDLIYSKLDLEELFDFSDLLTENELRDPFVTVLKISEEAGEVSSSFLRKMESLNASQSSNPDILEEITDLLMNCIDLARQFGFDAIHIQEMLNKKMIKWKSKYKGKF